MKYKTKYPWSRWIEEGQRREGVTILHGQDYRSESSFCQLVRNKLGKLGFSVHFEPLAEGLTLRLTKKR